MITFSIPPNDTYCNPHNLADPGDILGMDFSIIFNPSMLFDLGSTNLNNAAQKLLGFYWKSNQGKWWDPVHNYSYRLCYSMYSPVNSKIKLHSYGYNKGMQKDYKTGAHLNTAFKEPNQRIQVLNKVKVDGSIQLDRQFNIIRLLVPQCNIDHLLNFDFRGVEKDAKRCYFYVEIPGHKGMTVEIGEVYWR